MTIMEPRLDKQLDFLNGYQLAFDKSGYSNKVSIWINSEGQKLVVRRTSEITCHDPEIVALSPFLNPDKLNKEFVILKFLEAQSLPIARCVHHEPSELSVYQWAAGTELDYQDYAKRPINERIRVGNNLGKLLGQFHNSQQGFENQVLLDKVPGRFGHKTPKDKHLWRLDASTTYLERQGVITEKDAKNLRAFGLGEFAKIPDTEFCVIHGDMYSRNIFIDPNSLKITAIIDWIDTSEVDDPLADLLLTARWYSFNDELTDTSNPANRDVFYSVVQGYREVNNLLLEQDAILLYKFYDLLWHLRVLVAEQAKGNAQTIEQFRTTLLLLLA